MTMPPIGTSGVRLPAMPATMNVRAPASISSSKALARHRRTDRQPLDGDRRAAERAIPERRDGLRRKPLAHRPRMCLVKRVDPRYRAWKARNTPWMHDVLLVPSCQGAGGAYARNAHGRQMRLIRLPLRHCEPIAHLYRPFPYWHTRSSYTGRETGRAARTCYTRRAQRA